MLLTWISLASIFWVTSAFQAITHIEEQTWKSVVSVHRKIIHSQLQPFTVFVEEVSKLSDISKRCSQSLKLYANGLRHFEESSLRLYDSSAKSWTGLSFDTDADFGHYLQCMESQFNGSYARYALFQVHFPQTNITFTDGLDEWTSSFRKHIGNIHYLSYNLFAVCLPNNCLADDLNLIVASPTVQKIMRPLNVTFHSSQSYGEDPIQEIRTISLISLFLVLLVVVMNIISTILSWFSASPPRIVKAFDMMDNFSKLIALPKTPSDERLYFYSLFKMLYMGLGIFAHTILPLNLTLLPLSNHLGYWLRRRRLYNIWNIPFLAINMNFVISASLTSLSLMPIIGKMPIPVVVLTRFLRILPVLLFSILFQLALPAVMVGGRALGPLFYPVYLNHTKNCIKNGWKEAFMMANFVPVNESCVSLSWFVSADFQMFIVSLPLLLALRKSFKMGLLIAAIQVLIGMKMHFDITLGHKIPRSLMVSEIDLDFTTSYTGKYGHPFGYIALYPIGLFVGYSLWKWKPSTKQGINWIMTFVSLSVPSIIIYVIMFKYDHRGVPLMPELYDRLWAVIQRPIMVSCFALFFYYLGMRWWLSLKVGSWRITTILSRISYSQYMFNCILGLWVWSRRSHQMDIGLDFILEVTSFVALYSIVGGFILTLLVEIPIGNAFKLIIDKEKIKSD